MTRLLSIGVRVYYEDTDAGGIVYYANYLRFFERARTDWLRAAGISHRELSEVDGLCLVVRDCTVQYLRPARLDDLLAVEVGIANPATDVGRASLRFSQRALLVDRPPVDAALVGRADGALVGRPLVGGPEGGSAPQEDVPAAGTRDVLATGSVRVACMNRHTGRPAALPARVLEIINEQVARK